MAEVKYTISDFSPHLFWDVNPMTLDLEKNKRLIVERVIQRGSRSDLAKLLAYYGRERVSEILKKIAWLNEKDMAFVHIYFDLPYSEMECYTKKRSVRHY